MCCITVADPDPDLLFLILMDKKEIMKLMGLKLDDHSEMVSLQSHFSNYFVKCLFFCHACTSWSLLPSNISTILVLKLSSGRLKLSVFSEGLGSGP